MNRESIDWRLAFERELRNLASVEEQRRLHHRGLTLEQLVESLNHRLRVFLPRQFINSLSAEEIYDRARQIDHRLNLRLRDRILPEIPAEELDDLEQERRQLIRGIWRRRFEELLLHLEQDELRNRIGHRGRTAEQMVEIITNQCRDFLTEAEISIEEINDRVREIDHRLYLRFRTREQQLRDEQEENRHFVEERMAEDMAEHRRWLANLFRMENQAQAPVRPPVQPPIHREQRRGGDAWEARRYGLNREDIERQRNFEQALRSPRRRTHDEFMAWYRLNAPAA
jgi:hypothetical protein